MRLRTVAAGSAVAALLSLSCSATSRHKVLTLFFDGVPPREEAPVAGATGPGSSAGAAPSRRIELVEHGPYAAGLCSSCHDRGATNALTSTGEELCSQCHVLDSGRKYVHGPFASGECLACHDPHSSRYRRLLVSDPGVLCFGCHDRQAVESIGGHGGIEEDCTSCHDAHGSDNQFLLR